MQSKIDTVIKSCLTHGWSTQKDSCYWWFGSYLGSYYSSQHYLALRFFNRLNGSLFNCEKFKGILLNTQKTDGGWQQIVDPNDKKSNLDATILNYWFLKASKSLEITDEPMKNARRFILENGGLQAANLFTKAWLCIFGNYEWDDVQNLPLLLFKDDPNNKRVFIKPHVAPWVYQAVLPIAYLRYLKVQKFLGDEFLLTELNDTPLKVTDHTTEAQKEKASKNLFNVIKQIDEMRDCCGTYASNTIVTTLVLFAQHDWNERFVNEAFKFEEKQIAETVKIVEEFFFEKGENSYLGIIADGRWWDTMFVSLAMLDCGEKKEKFKNVVKNLLENAVKSDGAVMYGIGFHNLPDADCTSVLIMLLAKYFRDECWDNIMKSHNWLMSLQNDDGGFGALCKGSEGNPFQEQFADKFQGCGELLDESSADVTGHVLEAWTYMGFTLDDDHVRKAVKYFKNTQTSFGAWEGRWGVNYIYGVGAVVPAIANIRGVDLMQMKWVLKSIDWLVSIQNEDGGFGESTLSYVDENWIGRGISTPSQTAWAVLALIEAVKAGYLVTEKKDSVSDCLNKAVEYLLRNFSVDKGKWVDESAVGTGHRKILYFFYPIYSICWPMIALARYQEYIMDRKH